MNVTLTDTRKMARQIVDELTYELHHKVTEPQIDFTRVPQREIVALIDHIERIIVIAILGKDKKVGEDMPRPARE